MNFRPSISLGLISIAVLFNLILVLFLVCSLKEDGLAVSTPNVPNDTYLSPNSITSWFDADALTLHHFFTGIEKGELLRFWKISTVSHYFPTIALYSIPYYLFKNPGLSLLIYVIIQLGLILAMFSWLAHQILKTHIAEAVSIGLMFISLFIIYPLYGPDLSIGNNLLMPYHSGMFLNVLLALIFLFKSFNNELKRNLILLSVVIILATLSNPLFHIYFTMPVIILLAILSIGNPKKYLIVITTLILSVVIGLILVKILPDLAIDLNLYPTYYESFEIMVYSLQNAFFSSFLMGLILTIFLFSFIYSSVFSMITLKKIRKASLFTNYEIYNLFFVIVVLVSFTAPIAVGNYVGIWCIRYIMYSIILGLFNIGFILSYHFGRIHEKKLNIFTWGLVISGICFVILRGYHQNPFGAFVRVKEYQNKLSNAVDELSLKYSLKDGIAEFWSAKPVTVFSKEQIKVLHTYSDMNIWYHSSYLLDYRYDSIDKPAYFNFIVLRNWGDNTQILNTFGDSIVMVSVDDLQFYLVPEFIYNDNFRLQLTGRFDFVEELEEQNRANSIRSK